MPSKELIALAANAMEERRKELIAQPLSRIYPQLAEAAAGAILATLLEPDASMLGAAEDICVDGPYLGRLDADLVWVTMLAASALGEQSDG